MENAHDANEDPDNAPFSSSMRTGVGPETGYCGPPGDSDVEDEAEVWQSFEQSVAYMRNLSDLYRDAFLAKKPTVPAVAHIHAAKNHAREALELLASNLLNASTAIVATMEHQEQQLAVVDDKLEAVKSRLRERQDRRDQESMRRFFESGDDCIPNNEPHANVSSSSFHGTSLKLTLAGPAASSSTVSASQSPYLYY